MTETLIDRLKRMYGADERSIRHALAVRLWAAHSGGHLVGTFGALMPEQQAGWLKRAERLLETHSADT